MTIQEASERYQIPMHILREYESWGLCGAVKKVMGDWQYCKTVRRVQVRRRTDGAAVRLFLRRRAKMCGITAGKTAIAMAIRNISGWMR